MFSSAVLRETCNKLGLLISIGIPSEEAYILDDETSQLQPLLSVKIGYVDVPTRQSRQQSKMKELMSKFQLNVSEVQEQTCFFVSTGRRAVLK